jgi:hypothetical protein
MMHQDGIYKLTLNSGSQCTTRNRIFIHIEDVDDRPNGATHVRRNGATLKWQN